MYLKILIIIVFIQFFLLKTCSFNYICILDIVIMLCLKIIDFFFLTIDLKIFL